MNSAIASNCCTPPPNPWLPFGQGGLSSVCNGQCVQIYNARNQPAYPFSCTCGPEQSIQSCLDNNATNFLNNMSNVTNALNASLIAPSSLSGTIAATPSQNAASSVNYMNLQKALNLQSMCISTSSCALLATTSSRLANNISYQSQTTLNSIKNVSISDLSTLFGSIPSTVTTLLSTVISTNTLVQSITSNVVSTSTSAQLSLSNALSTLTAIQVMQAVAISNSVPNSLSAKLVVDAYNISTSTAKRQVELATSNANYIQSELSVLNTISTTTAVALNQVSSLNITVSTVNGFFTDATAKNLLALSTFTNLEVTDSSGNPISTVLGIAHTANVLASNANLLLPPTISNFSTLTAMSMLPSSINVSTMTLEYVTAMAAQTSYLVNVASGNIKSLSHSLNKQMKAAMIPVQNPITAQMIATQTAAAQRFGADAAIALATAERISNAPPVPPALPPAGHAEYSVAMPIRSVSGGRRVADQRAQMAARAMAVAPRNLYIYKTC